MKFVAELASLMACSRLNLLEIDFKNYEQNEKPNFGRRNIWEIGKNRVSDLPSFHCAYIHKPIYAYLLLHNIQSKEPSSCGEFSIIEQPVRFFPIQLSS